MTTVDLFGEDFEIHNIPQVKKADERKGDTYRSFNPSVVQFNNELVYVYRVSNAVNCHKPVDLIVDKHIVANNPSKSSFITLSNGKRSVDINSKIVGGKMCSKGYEDPRALLSPDGEHLWISASATTGPNCKSEMWLLDISTQSYHDAQNVGGEGSIIPSREIKMNIKFDVTNYQKNWMPFYDGNDLMFVYSINPHIILKCDPDTGNCVKVADTKNDDVPDDLRGGSQVIPFKNEFIAATHRQTSGHSYVTQFYTFENKYPYRVTGVTPDFKFASETMSFSRIQFVAGFSIIPDEKSAKMYPQDGSGRVEYMKNTAVLTYGEEDCYSRECRIPMDKIMKALIRVDLLKNNQYKHDGR